jgi:hypothetical protein
MNHRFDRVVATHHLHPKLIDSLEIARLAKEGSTARHRFELSSPANLPGAATVVADPTGAGAKDRLLDFLDVRIWNVEAE